MKEEQFQRFLDLAFRLEPENLSADGERPKSQIKKLRAVLLKEWGKLEKEVGRSVTTEEVWNKYLNESRFGGMNRI